jgi:hypothetical protein
MIFSVTLDWVTLKFITYAPLTAIDRSQICSAPKSKSESFESLVVHLFIETWKTIWATLVVHRGDGGWRR